MTKCKILKETENGGLLIKDTTDKDRIVKTSRMFLSQFCIYSSRKHINNTDDSLLLSSITSKMHQFYIEYRKHWWTFDDTSIFDSGLQSLSMLKPANFHLLNNDDSSMKQRSLIEFRTANQINITWNLQVINCMLKFLK